MSTVTVYHCDNCGAEVPTGTAHEFSGTLGNQCTVASGGAHQWHSCSGKCAAEYMRKLADKIEERAAHLDRERERANADRAHQLAMQAAAEHALALKRARET